MATIGILSDTHVPSTVLDPQPLLVDLFNSVDLILHGGDIYAKRVLDWLAALAPVYAADGGKDEPDPRIQWTHLLTIDGRKVGLVHDFLAEYPYSFYFSEPADLVVVGHTHMIGVETHHQEGMPLVNPGSTSFPTATHRSDIPGNAGLLDIGRDGWQVAFYSLEPGLPVVGEHDGRF